MPTSCFHWHPDARAFVGAQEVVPEDGPPLIHITAHPATSALNGLHRTLGNGAPFCVSDTAPQGLAQLTSDSFATLTGGTSGTPKVIKRTQASWIRSFECNAAHFDYTPGDSIAVLGVLSHSLALYGVLEGLHLGLNVHALSPLKPRAQITEMAKHGCSILYATPTQLRLLPTGTPLPDLRLILCGGGALTATVRAHVAKLAPNATLHAFYGAAETSFVTLTDAQTPEGSVGRAYYGVEIEVRDRDTTGTGCVWVRSPYLFDGYIEGHSPHTKRSGEWLTVGEYGTLDAQGYLHLRGRAGRMINIADTVVFPEELEAQIGALPGISTCAILARPDALRGHHLIAVLAGPEMPRLRDLVLSHCEASALVRPRAVMFLDPFPLLPSGKPDLPRVAAMTGCI